MHTEAATLPMSALERFARRPRRLPDLLSDERRVFGVPASGDNMQQAFSSCWELQACSD
jgi:hypothetical protein